VAISNEEEDGRIYGEFADALRDSYPATAEMFEEMRVEEAGHRDRLLALFRQRFGITFRLSAAKMCAIPEPPSGMDDAALGVKVARARPKSWRWKRAAFIRGRRASPQTLPCASC